MIDTKRVKNKKGLRNLKEKIFNNLSLRFEGVEDQTRREVVMMALNSWVTWELNCYFFYLFTNNPQASCE
jgi:hypothetical protein